MAYYSIQEYKDSLKSEAEDVILNSFPCKIVELKELLLTQQFRRQDFSDIHETLNIPNIIGETTEPPVKKLRRDDSESMPSETNSISSSNYSIPCNKQVCEFTNSAKPHFRQLLHDSNFLRMWTSLMMPKIESGDNFGMEVHESILKEVQLAEAKSLESLQDVNVYFLARAKAMSKVIRYPQVDDYRKAIQELDEEEYLTLQWRLQQVHNTYCILHDTVIKNLEKLKMPRSSCIENS